MPDQIKDLEADITEAWQALEIDHTTTLIMLRNLERDMETLEGLQKKLGELRKQ